MKEDRDQKDPTNIAEMLFNKIKDRTDIWKKELNKIVDAFRFASYHHRNQYRENGKGNIDFIIHPLISSHILVDYFLPYIEKFSAPSFMYKSSPNENIIGGGFSMPAS